MISTEGKVKVTDFGIARAATSNTISSDVMGSVHYSSPEQARNGFVDGKSDIYSLGIVMYEMVTGRVPFDGDTTVAVAIQHLQEEMVPPSAFAPNLPISMEKIILKCTQKSADRRYESMTALLADLRKALISPDEDFVVMVPQASQDKTRVIGADDLSKIQKQAGSVYLKQEEKFPKIQPAYEEEEPDDDEDEYDDEEGEINPKLEKAITIMGIAAAVVIVILIIYIAVHLFGGISSGKKNTANTETTQTETQKDSGTTEKDSSIKDGVSVPSVAGMSFDDAKAELAKYKLGIRQAGTVSSDTVDKDLVVSQQPEANETVEKNSTIEVTLSSGKGSIDVPNVVGKSEADAVAALGTTFNCNKSYAYNSDVQEGYVISQSPESGTQGKEGDTVTLVISQGEELVTVPDVTTTYKSEEQAKALLSDFNVNVTTKYSQTAEGIVIGQSIDSGKQVAKGTSITITVSLGEEPAEVVTTTTYKLNIRIELPADSSNISGADIVLYGKSGGVLASWPGKSVSEFGSDGLTLTKTGLLEESGSIVITWIDLNGNACGEQTNNITFQKES